MEGTLVCGKCGQVKHECDFYFVKGKLARPCKQCRAEYLRQWVEENPDKRAATWRRSRERNRERYNEHSRAYNARHPERKRISSKAWVERNPEKRKHVRHNYYATHPEQYRVAYHKRRAAIIGNGGSHTVADIRGLFELQGGKCANLSCRKTIRKEFHVDHVLALSLGGTNDIGNIQLLCPTCNLRKNAKPPDRWAAENGLLF